MTSKRLGGEPMGDHEDPPTMHRIGPDRVLVGGDRLVIESPVDMEYWEVRTYRHTMIGFAGRCWRIVRTGTGSNKAFRYELEPWTPSPAELTGPTCDYGPAFVERRDRESADRRRRHMVGVFLVLVLPLIGVLGSATKRRIEARHAIRAIAATRASLYVEGVMMLASATLLVIGSMVTVLGYPAPWPLGPLALGALILSPDLLFRYDRLVCEEQYPPGFYQWLWRRKTKYN